MSSILIPGSLNFGTSTCIGCAKFFECRDPHKSSEWTCTQFSRLEDAHVDDLLGAAQLHVDLSSTAMLEFGDDDPDELGEFQEMIERALSTNRLLPLDLSVDDSSIVESPNYYDWTVGSGHIKFTPFARQMWIAGHTFAEFCPRCSDPDWFHNVEAVPVDYRAIDLPDKLQFMDNGVCPNCGSTRSEMWKAGDLNVYQESALCLGQRAGKSIQTAGLCSYHLHKLLKTVRPSEFYGLAGSTTLTHTYTGLQFKRAFALLWTPIRDTILDSPWFRQYHGFLKSEGDRLGEELVSIKDSFINWRRSRLFAGPAAPNTGTLRGDTRAGAAIDELGLFKFGDGSEDYVTISADEIHASLANSMATVRTAATKMLRSGENNVQQGLMFNISSPMSVFDKIMTLVRAAKTSRKLFGLRLPTWEINPLVTREDLQIYWDSNAVKAERDFGANPPLAAAPFFEDHDALTDIFKGPPNRVTFEIMTRTNKAGMLERCAKVTNCKPLASQPPTLMTLDAGVTNNSFSLAISFPVAKASLKVPPRQGSVGYAKKPTKPQPPDKEKRLDLNVESGENLRCQTQLIVEVIPPKGGRINFKAMMKFCIVPLLVPFNVKVVVTDRWNSILLLDTLRDDHGVDTFQYSLRYKDFEAIRSYIEGGRLQGPALESRSLEDILSFDQDGYPYCFEGRPIDHTLLQFCTVQDTGRTVDKGPNLTDDSFRAMMLAMHYLRDIDFVRQYLAGPDKSRFMGGGLVAAPGGDSQQSSVIAMSSNGSRGMIAAPGGGGETSNVFARTKK